MFKHLLASLLAISAFTVHADPISASHDHSIYENQDLILIQGNVFENYKQIAQSTVTCFKTGEQISGMNKICYYSCAGSQAAITIRSTQLCPLNIRR